MKKKKLIWQIPFLLILIVGTIVIIRQQHNTPYQKGMPTELRVLSLHTDTRITSAVCLFFFQR